MTSSSFFIKLRRAVICSCMALAILALTVPARADNPPKVSDPAATEYLQKMSDAMDALMKALVAKDADKTKELSAKLNELGNAGDPIIGKLPQADQEIAGKWAQDQMKKLVDAGWSPGQ